MSKKYEVVFATNALRDLNDIFYYISHSLKETQTANRMRKSLEDAAQSLNVFPERYPVFEREPWKSQNIRKLSVKRYIILYRVQHRNQTVEILRIVYGGRDIDSMKIIDD